MKDKDLLKILLADGWELVSIKGSNHKIRKNDTFYIMIAPVW